MYKKRRLAQPALPSGPEHVEAALQSSRCSLMTDGSPFYCGLANPDDTSSATVIASDAELDLLKTATHVYFDGTFEPASHATTMDHTHVCSSCGPQATARGPTPTPLPWLWTPVIRTWMATMTSSSSNPNRGRCQRRNSL